MSAVTQIQYYGNSASEPTGVNAETGLKFNREQTLAGATNPLPIPATGGPGATAYSFIKQLALAVISGGGTTSILNRRVYLAATPSMPTGVDIWFKGTGTYVNDTSGNSPTDSATTNDALPAGYTLMTTSAQAYDTATVAAGTTYPNRNGNFCVLVLGVSFTYVGGAGNFTLPNITFVYDEV